ncbi:DUF3987 domain-containing protein [Halodesulfovibrio marinisediminis]|uniref:DUF3987 domain-containing protein n=1 Tax=Halodesulfovibrio marinisediminis DSM 17456 TaxID=1121457 RepID=A0A1N6IFT9_9BACT|nr:DUF3987 domain-containing protein [Halodesulfovibrio marinisediminis]SIO30883.1 Protein of unknown function [Halodesulfovibrio marinisediminis DSM 17456]
MPYSNVFSPCSPATSLPKIPSDYVYGLASELGVSADLVAVPVLAATATLLMGGTCEVSPSFVVGSSLYFAAGAPPSSGKTPCLERVMALATQSLKKNYLLSPEEVQERISIREVESARLKALERAAAKEEDVNARALLAREHSELQGRINRIVIPQSPLMAQFTPYSIVKELVARDGIGSNINAEGGVLAELYSVSPEKIRPLLSAWSSEEISDVTKKHAFFHPNPTFIMGILWQDQPLIKLLRVPKYRENGLVARILPLIITDAKFSRYGFVSSDSERELGSLFSRILCASVAAKSSGESLKFTLSDAAADCFSLFRVCVDKLIEPGNLFEGFKDVAGKLDLQAIKLAMVLHALRSPLASGSLIERDTMHGACNLALYFAEQMIKVLGTAEENAVVEECKPLIKLLIQWGMTNPLGTVFNVGQLKRPIGFSKAKCDRLLFWLAQRKAVNRSEAWLNKPDGKAVLMEWWEPIVPVLNSLVNE